MPLKIKLKVGEDTFEVEGDAMDPSLVELAKAWTAALPPQNADDADVADQIAAQTGQLRANREDLTAAVDGAQPDA
jgi:hypothetical protein